MYVKALIPFTERDNSGNLFSPAAGSIFEVTSEKGASLISQGLAEEYNLITPTGTKTITENGTGIDVTHYATATVNVGMYTVSYNVNGDTGTVPEVIVVSGNAITLNNGSTLTPPESKIFSGWATTATAEESDATSPYTPHADTTLYAVYITSLR